MFNETLPDIGAESSQYLQISFLIQSSLLVSIEKLRNLVRVHVLDLVQVNEVPVLISNLLEHLLATVVSMVVTLGPK